MAKLKAAFFLALVVGLVALWSSRRVVTEAYTDTEPVALEVRLDGIDLDHQLTPLSPSPYTVDTAPDTREASIAVAYTEAAAESSAAREPEPVELEGGTAWLKGVVKGPDGALAAGATVRIERHTAAGSTTVDVTADAQGRWNHPHLLGGRYRVRAWHPEGFASNGSQVLFLAQDETRSIEVAVVPFNREPVLTFADAGDIYVGLTGTVAVTVTTNVIDDAGLLSTVGVPGAMVSLLPSSGVMVAPEEATADSDGVARFQIRCLRAGSVTAMARSGLQEVLFVLPDCLPQLTTTLPPTTDGSRGYIPTTKPPSPSSTTTIPSGGADRSGRG